MESGTTPETSRKYDRENQEYKEARSQNDPHPEVCPSVNWSPHSMNLDRHGTSHLQFLASHVQFLLIALWQISCTKTWIFLWRIFFPFMGCGAEIQRSFHVSGTDKRTRLKHFLGCYQLCRLDNFLTIWEDLAECAWKMSCMFSKKWPFHYVFSLLTELNLFHKSWTNTPVRGVPLTENKQ